MDQDGQIRGILTRMDEFSVKKKSNDLNWDKAPVLNILALKNRKFSRNDLEFIELMQGD